MILELPDNNLYATGRIIDFNDGSNELVLLRDKIVYEADDLDEYHTVKHMDAIDKIAFDRYSKYVEDASKYWWVIADANNIDNPLDLSEWVGKDLVIPYFLKVRLQFDYESSDN